MLDSPLSEVAKGGVDPRPYECLTSPLHVIAGSIFNSMLYNYSTELRSV